MINMLTFFSLFILVLVGCTSEVAPPQLGMLLVETEHSDKQQYKLNTLLPEGGAVVNFWASWCEPCREEMPQLNLLAEKLEINNIAVLLVSVDEDRFLFEEYLLKYPQRLDVFRTNAANSPETLPSTYIVNARGQVLKTFIGMRDWSNDDIVDDIIQSLNGAK